MKRIKIMIIMVLMVLAFLPSCRAGKSKSEFDFANKLASQELWQEAYLRWQKALAQGYDSAGIHNNMAIALETMGKPDEAEKEYKKALALDPNNSQISSNFEKFKKIFRKGEK